MNTTQCAEQLVTEQANRSCAGERVDKDKPLARDPNVQNVSDFRLIGHRRSTEMRGTKPVHVDD
jgi:hypothetical protein